MLQMYMNTFMLAHSLRPRTHVRGTRRAKHIEFLVEFSVEAAEDLGGPTFLIEQRGNREHVLYLARRVPRRLPR